MIPFTIRTWEECNNPQYGPTHHVAYGQDVNENEVCLHFVNYYEMISIKLPYQIGKRIPNWEKQSYLVKEAIQDYCKKMNVSLPPITNILGQEHNQKYFVEEYGIGANGYSDKCFRVMSFRCPSPKHKRELQNMLSKTGVKIPINESITIVKFDILNVEVGFLHKFLVERNINYNGWVECIAKKSNWEFSSGHEDYIVKHDNVFKSTRTGFDTPIVLALDLECLSVKEVFPDRNNISDIIGMISLVYARNKFTDVKREIISLFPCDQISGVTSYFVDGEDDLLRLFIKRIKDIKPGWMIGHNLDGFDMPYIVARCNMYGIKIDFSKDGSEAKPIILRDMMNGRFTKGIYLNAFGILTKDTVKLVKSKHPKWSSYTLENSAHELFPNDPSMHKIDIGEFDVIFRAMKNYDNPSYEQIEFMTRVTEYCVVDSYVSLMIFFKMNNHIDDCTMSNVCCVPIKILNTKGQMVRCKNAIYKQIYNTTFYDYKVFIDFEQSDLVSFKGGNVKDPIAGSHAMIATVDYVSLYPSIIIRYNICYTTYIPERYYALMDMNPEYMKLGLRYDEKTNPDGKWIEIECEEETPSGETKIFRYRFVTEKVRKGILPSIAEMLKEERSAAKKQMAIADNEHDALLFDILQLALKVFNNSLYGFLNSPGIYCFSPGARSVTSKGRQLKNYIETWLETEKGCIIIYGDTDSVMFKNPKCKTIREAYEDATAITKEINDVLLSGALRMEMEKCGYMLSIGKKTYVYWEYNYKKDCFPNYFNEKGVPTVKRDRCEFHKILYRTIVKTILHNEHDSKMSTEECANYILNYIWQSCIDMYFGVSADVFDVNGMKLNVYTSKQSDYEISYKMGKDYAEENFYLNVLSNRLATIGRPVNVGERFKAIFIKNSLTNKKGGKMFTSSEYKDYMLEYESYYQAHTRKEPTQVMLDKLYYLQHQVQGTTDNLYYTAFMPLIGNITDVKSRTKIMEYIETLYMTYGSDLLSCLSNKKDGFISVMTSPNNRISTTARDLYNKTIIGDKKINYYIGPEIILNFSKHIIARMKVMDDIALRRKEYPQAK